MAAGDNTPNTVQGAWNAVKGVGKGTMWTATTALPFAVKAGAAVTAFTAVGYVSAEMLLASANDESALAAGGEVISNAFTTVKDTMGQVGPALQQAA